jgi:hypothetical protein
MKLSRCWLLLFLSGLISSLISPVAAAEAASTTPYARQGSLALARIELLSTNAVRGGRVEIAAALSATYRNPFDSSEVTLDAAFTAPSGRRYAVPGFFHQEFRRELTNRSERLTAVGEPGWRVRFTPEEAGVYRFELIARDKSGTAKSPPQSFQVGDAPMPGFVRVSAQDPRYFAFDNGQPCFPIGGNVCWSYGSGTFNYDDWFPKFAAAGCNYARLWLSPHWTTFALEQPGKPENGKGLGQFDLANAWRIDYVLDLATRHGLRLMLCIDSYNILREKDGYPQWDATPHNAKNGGPLQRPTEFWTNAVMENLYLDKLRYLVARYGWSPNVFSWEFWNEADITTGYQSGPSRAWHAKMAAALRALDPWRHLITTSFANTTGDKEVDALPGLDYVQTHHYGSPDLVPTLAQAQAQKAAFGKPHVVGEIGADAGGPRAKDDPRGYQIHDPIWISLATGGAGTAQPWWWDNAIAPQNLYGLFTPAAKFTAGIDWPREGFKTVVPRVEWLAKPAPLPRKDLVLKSGPMSWNPSEVNQPRRVKITPAGASGQLPVAGLQHGLGGHRALHNPVTLGFDLSAPARFEVEVGDVSGWGGAKLKVTLDGRVAIEKDFADPDGSTNTRTLRQYTGSYGVDLPSGQHTVVVENTGPDWFMVSYRVRNLLEQTGPPVLAWQLAGSQTALAWLRHEDRSWQALCVTRPIFTPVPEPRLVLGGLAPGSWDAEVWDTWTGAVLRQTTVTASANGEAPVTLPSFEHDLAVKLRRVK